VLRLMQEFDPIGVAARDLRECLLIQLRRLGKGEIAGRHRSWAITWMRWAARRFPTSRAP
jgi:DNA-directed RNA polymerase specialized sigma54-like protein